MDNTTGLVALIPAWGDATNQNPDLLRDYCRKPLIQHTFDLIERCQEIQKVMIGTNIDAIERMAPTERTFHVYRSDKTISLRSCLEHIEKKEGDYFKWLLILNPFYPFRSPENIMECYQRVLIDGLARGIQAVCESSKDKSMMGPTLETSLGIWRRDWIFSEMENDDIGHIIPYEMPVYSFVSLENKQNDGTLATLIDNPCQLLNY